VLLAVKGIAILYLQTSDHSGTEDELACVLFQFLYSRSLKIQSRLCVARFTIYV
jgi:hypothetical protein